MKHGAQDHMVAESFAWNRIAALQRAYAAASDEFTTINSGVYAVLGVSVAAAVVFIGHVPTNWLLCLFLAPVGPIAYVMGTRLSRGVPDDPTLALSQARDTHGLLQVATTMEQRLQMRSDHVESVRRYEIIALGLFLVAFVAVALAVVAHAAPPTQLHPHSAARQLPKPVV